MINVRKKLGIVGGMGSRAGVFLLQKIINYSPAEKDQDFLDIIFHNNANVPDRTRAIVFKETSPVNAIMNSFTFFDRNEVEVIVLACITSYYYYRELSAVTNAYIINPLKLMDKKLRTVHPNKTRIGILATTGSINSRIFHQELDRPGIEILTLDVADQENLLMRSIYMKNGYKSAQVSQEAKLLMAAAFEKLKDKNVEIIIAGCTEISLAVSEMPEATSGVVFIDALDLLARDTVQFCYNL